LEVNMNIRRIAQFTAATFIVGTAAFAQSDTRSSVGQQSKNGSATGSSMTVTGCLMKEADYRKAHGLGKGALLGVGLGDEFVLVDATDTAASSAATTPASPSSAGCTETGNGKAYRLTGKTEDKLKSLVGHRIEVTGQFDHERDAKTAAGQTDAKLPPEIKIASYHEASASSRASSSANAAPASSPAASASTTPPAAPSPSTPSAQSNVASNDTTAGRRLPNTGTNDSLIILIGLISLSAAFAVRAFRFGAA
jgi:LPXTG-motif cell wall-anchored protein